MKVSEIFPGKYLRSEDVVEGEELVIEQVTMESMPDGKDKLAIWFVASQDGRSGNSTKALVLNATNRKILVTAFGDDTDGWIQRGIRLSTYETLYRGEPVEAIKVVPLN